MNRFAKRSMEIRKNTPKRSFTEQPLIALHKVIVTVRQIFSDGPAVKVRHSLGLRRYSLSETAAAYKNIMLSTKQMKQSFSMSSEQILEKLGAQDKQVTLDKVTAQAGKNLVIIYCESLEANFLQNQNFTDEVPNLNNLLAQGWHSYTNYRCLDGADWTVGALYATQTGLPAYLGANSDTLFGGVRQSGAVSYAGVLKKAGYKNLLLSNGDMNFAGTGNIMSCFCYEVKYLKFRE